MIGQPEASARARAAGTAPDHSTPPPSSKSGRFDSLSARAMVRTSAGLGEGRDHGVLTGPELSSTVPVAGRAETSRGISRRTGPGRPDVAATKARRNAHGISSGRVCVRVGSDPVGNCVDGCDVFRQTCPQT